MESPTALKCPNCGSQLRDTDMNLDTGIVRCSYCRALSTLPTRTAPTLEGFRTRSPVALPPRMTCDQDGVDVIITRSWFSHAAWFLVFFCIAWDAFLIFWYTMAFAAGAPWIFKIFPIAHVAVGVGLTYTVLTMFMNRTLIRAGSGQFSIRHGPLPWFGNFICDSSAIEQLYCKENISHGRQGSSTTYQLWANLRDGTSKKLIGSVMDIEQVLFVEQRIEKALGIRDKAVGGEIPR